MDTQIGYPLFILPNSELITGFEGERAKNQALARSAGKNVTA